LEKRTREPTLEDVAQQLRRLEHVAEVLNENFGERLQELENYDGKLHHHILDDENTKLLGRLHVDEPWV
jgi:hypothetical protein